MCPVLTLRLNLLTAESTVNETDESVAGFVNLGLLFLSSRNQKPWPPLLFLPRAATALFAAPFVVLASWPPLLGQP